MAMVRFYKIATASSLPTPTAKTEGHIYFVEDTQSFYKGSSKTVDNTTTYEFTPVKVLINGAAATLSDADVVKVRNNDNTLSAASQAKLDKPMDTEALYKTFETRSEALRVYIVPDAELVYDSISAPAAGSNGTVSDINIEATLASNALLPYKDGRTIVMIKKPEYIYLDNSYYAPIDSVKYTTESYGQSYDAHSLIPNPTKEYNFNLYDSFIYIVANNTWEKINDSAENMRPRWNIFGYSEPDPQWS